MSSGNGIADAWREPRLVAWSGEGSRPQRGKVVRGWTLPFQRRVEPRGPSVSVCCDSYQEVIPWLKPNTRQTIA